ncbi:MAG: MFS transporter, partial [Candidatus Buchananbacteria bacterium]|nr:MFS transporter [Candidatus Buchananbacteria bacterium]
LLKRPNLEKIFYLMFLLQFFYAVMVIYTPIYLNQTIGLPWDQLGIIFTVMLIPFILIEYPAGYLADKYWGEKELLTIGLFIIIISLILIFLVETKSIIIWALLLFLTRIGASLLEIMSDTYFFKKINHNDIALINSYRSTRPLAYIFAPFIFGLILYIFPVHYVFLFLAAIVSTGLYFSLTLKDTK